MDIWKWLGTIEGDGWSWGEYKAGDPLVIVFKDQELATMFKLKFKIPA